MNWSPACFSDSCTTAMSLPACTSRSGGGVLPEEAISVFFHPTAEEIWIAEKRCYETRTRDHTLVWLWQDEACTQVMVITCVRLERIDQP